MRAIMCMLVCTGFTTWRHGSLHGGVCNAIQAETNYVGLRDSHVNQQVGAKKIVHALYTYSDLFMGTQVAKKQ